MINSISCEVMIFNEKRLLKKAELNACVQKWRKYDEFFYTSQQSCLIYGLKCNGYEDKELKGMEELVFVYEKITDVGVLYRKG